MVVFMGEFGFIMMMFGIAAGTVSQDGSLVISKDPGWLAFSRASIALGALLMLAGLLMKLIF